MFKFEFRFMGDRRHPLMRLAFRLTRRFILAEAVTIGGLSLVIGTAIGIGLARLLGVVFAIPAQGLAWPLADLATLVGLALLGMFVSAWLSSRRLAGVKVVEALREL